MKDQNDVYADVLRTLDDTRQMMIIRQSMIKASAESLPRGATVDAIINKAKEFIGFILYGESEPLIPEIDLDKYIKKEE